MERDQAFLFPPDMRDWLPADHPVHLVIRVVEGHLDTSAFHALRRTGGAGAAGYDPDMLVTVLVWAYAQPGHLLPADRAAVRHRCCVPADLRGEPARSRDDRPVPGGLRGAGHAVLRAGAGAVRAAVGMGRLGVVALDGTKITAYGVEVGEPDRGQPARSWPSRPSPRHGETDAAEDALFGAGAARR